jgi:hypothetical protein
MEGIKINNIEFAKNPNAIFVAIVPEYYLKHSSARGLGSLVTEIDKLER